MSLLHTSAVRPLLVALVAGALFTACDSDTQEDTDGSAPESATDADGDATERVTGGDAAEPTTGEGELAIGDTTFTFESDSCSIGSGSGDSASVDIEGTGAEGGREFTVQIVRSQPADNLVERVTLAYSGTEASVFTAISAPAEAAFEVDDATVTGVDLAFIGAGGAPSGRGDLTVNCAS